MWSDCVWCVFGGGWLVEVCGCFWCVLLGNFCVPFHLFRSAVYLHGYFVIFMFLIFLVGGCLWVFVFLADAFHYDRFFFAGVASICGSFSSTAACVVMCFVSAGLSWVWAW